MSDVRVALDSTTAIFYLNRLPEVTARFLAEPGVALPTPVAGELFFGALNSGRPTENYSRYERFVEDAVVLPIDLEVARQYADLRLAQTRGSPDPAE